MGSWIVTFFVCFLKVLLCASSQMNSIVECWSLRKEGLPVNNIFQHRSPVGKHDVFEVYDSSMTLRCSDAVRIQVNHSILSVCSGRKAADDSEVANPFSYK